MTARGYATIVALIALAAVASAIGLFAVQNHERKVQLSLELPFHLAKFQFEQPQPVAWLVGGAFAGGFVLASLVFGVRSLRLAGRVRRLEREAALSSMNTRSAESTARTDTPEWR